MDSALIPENVTVGHTKDGHIEMCFTGDGFDITFALTQARAANMAVWIRDEVAEVENSARQRKRHDCDDGEKCSHLS